ncbi:MAG: DNA translocase FtsK [Clostridiales bacterium]|nr:DNA translocase FtsK [Clostridiales bacterium]
MNPTLAKETLLWLALAICLFIFISFFGIGGYIGTVISDICFGIFGISAYIFPFLMFLAAAFLISNRGSRLAGEKFGACLLLYFCICCFAALIEGQYTDALDIGRLYARCASMKQGGGVIGGTLCHLLGPALGPIGTAVLLVVLALIAMVLITQKSLLRGVKKQGDRVYHSAKESSERRREERRQREEWQRFEKMSEHPDSESFSDDLGYVDSNTTFQQMPQHAGVEYTTAAASDRAMKKTKNRQLDVSVMFSAQPETRRKHRHASGVTMNTKITGESAHVGADVHEILPKAYDSANAPAELADESGYINLEEARPEQLHISAESKRDAVSNVIHGNDSGNAPVFEQYPDMDALHIEGVGLEEPENSEAVKAKNDAGAFQSDVKQIRSDISSEDNGRDSASAKMKDVRSDDLSYASGYSDEYSNHQQDSEASPDTQETAESEQSAGSASSQGPASGKFKRNPRSSEQEIADGIASVEAEAAAIEAAKPPRPEYVFPPLDLLHKGENKTKKGQEQEIRQTAAKLQQTLNSFGVHVTVTNVSCGPSVTRYELLPEQGVKVSRIVSLADDIKLNLAAADIRIEAPIPGKSAVGIEVPNSENSAVPLRDLLESDEFRNHKSKLAFATGKDLGGKVVVSDIAKMPHLLIAGATGSGKSVCINTIIMSILYKAKPDEVKLIMIDPKVVELSVYNGIPHLFIPVVTDPKKAAGALNWGVAEMTDRYAKFAEVGVRDLKGYNQKIDALKDVDDPNKPEKLPQIVIIVDELADLMMVAPGEVEDSICRLAQLARAAGIHLIIATQRPSVNVITGLIKANMPSRIAFSVSSGVDSRTIIDMYGAEKLLGKGDMLFYPQGYQKPARVQGAFVTDEEVADVVDFLKNSNSGFTYDPDMEQKIAKAQQATAAAKGATDTDELFADAGKFIIEKDKASIGMLQRVFKIGFNRAARIMDQLSDAGVVGPEEGTKPRKILMSQEQFENYLEEN